MATKSARYAVEGVASATPEIAWDVALQTTPTAFYPKFGPLPAVIEVQNQPPTWDRVGYTRTLLLSDGGSVVEHITESDRGVFFGYDLTDFQKLFGRLVSGARAEWTFTTDAGGTRIRWSYAFHPLPGRGPIVRAIVALFWAPYMRRVLPGIIAAI
ncbi:hypothetical protein BH09ACT1_BH09ACT1_21180 [soil metagenome]